LFDFIPIIIVNVAFFAISSMRVVDYQVVKCFEPPTLPLASVTMESTEGALQGGNQKNIYLELVFMENVLLSN